jgi:alkanesulfonate monooxygenase SsuD/methylene tetrahydromethanopterin reductase-like flavin-dependent oxidoreductase (luciferase family)
VEVGLHFTSRPGLGAGLADDLTLIAAAVEDLGLHSIWAMDQEAVPAHLDGAGGALPEAYSTLAFLAAHTSRAELGVLVSDVTRREPELTVQAAATLDELSGGRAWLGLGIPRVEGRLDPAATEAVIALARARRPGLRILVGGGGERVTLPLVARSADACNLLERIGPEELRRKLAALDAECRAIGRPRSEIATTTFGALGPAEELPGRLRGLAAAGVDLALLDLGDLDLRQALGLIADRSWSGKS